MKRYLWGGLCILWGLFACTTTHHTEKRKTAADKPPFVVVDSSKVRLLEGGVKCFMLREGKGDFPKLSSKVLVNYHGRMRDGKVFDSSYLRGEPAEFPLNAVIKGFQVGFLQAKPGAKFVLIVPPSMGYGSISVGGIPPNSTLIFDCELISVF